MLSPVSAATTAVCPDRCDLMAATGIVGIHAMPNGLRHGFGVNTFQSNVPSHFVQRWLGHASLEITVI